MMRKIIKIDTEKCNGCGQCASACHEGAIGMEGGKAVLLRDDYCDGLGDCLPVCPVGAIRFEEREAAAYDGAAVKARQRAQSPAAAPAKPGPGGCPGSRARAIRREGGGAGCREDSAQAPAESQLAQWPVQMELAPPSAPYFKNAKLLIAADCAAYAYADFHRHFMRGHVTLIGCPKLDDSDYAQKLGEIIRQNKLQSITVVRMEVPCCGGIVNAVKTALAQNPDKLVPWQVFTLSTDGQILDDYSI